MSKLTAAACAGLIILVPTTAIAQSISVVEGTALEFTEVSQPEVEIRLTFAEKKGTAALVRLQVLPFASAGRAVGTTLWDGASEVGEVRVPANGMARVFLRATLVEAGRTALSCGRR